jgi:hypothetical protein
LPPLTPGRITALWVILTTLKRFGSRAEREEVRSFASRSSLRSGGLPISEGLELARVGNFVREIGANIELAPLGQDALSQCTDDEPTPAVRRLFLSVLMLKEPPYWVAYWQGDPSSLDVLLSDSDRRMLADANLYPPDRRDFVRNAWWDALSTVPLPQTTSAIRKAIGDAGEQMTLDFERDRLTREGFPGLARDVWWAANESAAYGFDVGSFAGTSYGTSPEQRIAIEVKSVSYPVTTVFPLHLTIHELRTAEVWSELHIFHLWERVQISPNGDLTATPRIVRLAALSPHLACAPKCDGNCRWESMYVELPLADCAIEALPKARRRSTGKSTRCET